MPVQRSTGPRLAILPLGVSGRAAPWRQHPPSTRIARLCACLCLSAGVASSSVLRGSANASAGGHAEGSVLKDLGFQKFELEHGGYNREFHVYVPEGVTAYNPAQGLVMFFHGKSVSVDGTCDGKSEHSFSVVPQADRRRFIAVCPQGLSSKPEDSGWNCDVCCGYPANFGPDGRRKEPSEEIDDVGFVEVMLDKLKREILPRWKRESGRKQELAYPTNNVFAFGFSTGGLFSFRLACDTRTQNRIHGIAPSGAIFDHGFISEDTEKKPIEWAEKCKTSVPVWNSMGTEDHYTNHRQAVDGFVKYAKLLKCQQDSCAQMHPEVGVACMKYTLCNGKHGKARLCVYNAGKHAVAPFKDTFRHGHVYHAWKFLTHGVDLTEGVVSKMKRVFRQTFKGTTDENKYGCDDLAVEFKSKLVAMT